MDWHLPDGSTPPYLKLINLIANAIEDGRLLPGTNLPAERQLASLLNINRSTVQHALSELVSRGILVRKVGSGTWVNPDKWGVLSQTVNWQSYLTSRRLSDPENYMVKLRRLESDPTSINLAHTSIPPRLALPLELRHITPDQILDQENHAAISGALALKQALLKQLAPSLTSSPDPTQMLITSGAQQAFYLITQGLLSYGDAIAIEEPSYFYQLSLFQAAGIRVYGVPLHPDGGLDLAVLEKLYYQHHLRFLFVNPTGQNPTGYTMQLDERQKLIACCRQLRLPIVEDDPHGLTNAILHVPIIPLKALDPENVLYVGSLSTITGAHTRIGWLVAPAAIVDRLAAIRQQMEAGISIFPQVVATQLLNQFNLPQQLTNQQQQLLETARQLDHVLAPFQQQRQLSYQLPLVGHHFWVHLNCQHPLTSADYQLFLTHKVLVRPDFLFGIRQSCFRISFSNLTVSQIAPLRQRLTTVIKQLTRSL